MTLINVLQRVELESYWRLTIAPSSLQRDGFNLGDGLFAGLSYRPGARIVHFRGEFIGRDVYDLRENRNYGVKMGAFVIDCYNAMKKKICKASMANSPTGCVFRSDPSKVAVANAICKKNNINRYAYLEAIKSIEVGEEIVWEYGDEFEF